MKVAKPDFTSAPILIASLNDSSSCRGDHEFELGGPVTVLI